MTQNPSLRPAGVDWCSNNSMIGPLHRKFEYQKKNKKTPHTTKQLTQIGLHTVGRSYHLNEALPS